MQPSAGPIAGVEQFVRDWSGRLLSTGPLTEAERTATVDAVRRCYRQAGLPWPGRVVWAPSPVAGQRMANELSRRHAGRAVRARTVARQAVRPEAAGLLAFASAGLLLASEVVVTLLALLPGDPVIRSAGDSWAQGSGAWIGGVAGGLARYTGIDPLLWRVGFVALALLGGSGFLVYLLLWVLMPPASDRRPGPLDGPIEQLRGAVTSPRTTGSRP